MVGGITQLGLSTGTTVRGDALSGEVFNRFQSLISQAPAAQYTSLMVGLAIDQAGLSGTDVDGLTGGVQLHAQLHADGGTRGGATSHRKLSINDGILVPRRLTCDHQGDAAITYEVLAAYDGSNDPIVILDAQSLPTAPDDNQRFTIGPVTIESVTIDHIRGFELDFGLNASTEGADSEYWDRFVSVKTIQPTLTLRGVDPEWLKAANIPLLGKNATHANTAIYLRKRADGGTWVADNTAEHIKFTMAGLCYIDGAFDANGQALGETSLVLQGVYDGSNDPIVIDTTSAIT